MPIFPVTAGIHLAEMRHIVVFRALFLGDMLCAVPALRALRPAAPNAEITLAGLPWAHEFAERFAAYVDNFVAFPGFPGLPEQYAEARDVQAFVAQMRQMDIDLAIQMHGDGSTSNRVITLLGAKHVAGFCVRDDQGPDRTTFLPYPADEHEIWRHLRLMERLGAPPVGDELEFPLDDEDDRRLERMEGHEALAENETICLHVGGKLASRRWPADRFAEVGNALARDGYHVVLTGTAGERSLVERVEALLRVPHWNLCGKTDLGALGALVKRARLIISNDTGISHVAAALKTPSVVIVLGSDPRRWAPLDGQRHRVVMQAVPCRPCEHVECPIGFPCAEQVMPADVIAAAREQLARRRTSEPLARGYHFTDLVSVAD